MEMILVVVILGTLALGIGSKTLGRRARVRRGLALVEVYANGGQNQVRVIPRNL